MIRIDNANILNRVMVESFTMTEVSCGVVGPNGAGKSSFLKMIAGLEEFQGRIERDGDISFCGDAMSLQGDMLAKEVLFYARGSKAQNLEFLNELVSHFSFSELLKRKVSTLSSGEKQRLNLISAFYYECEFTLLDEPTNYLDPIYVDLLSSYLKKWGKKVFIVSHDLNFLIDNSKQLIAFNKGKVSFDGSCENAFNDEVFNKVFNKKFKYHSIENRRYIL